MFFTDILPHKKYPYFMIYTDKNLYNKSLNKQKMKKMSSNLENVLFNLSLNKSTILFNSILNLNLKIVQQFF